MSLKKTKPIWTILGIIILIIVFYFLGKHTDFITRLLVNSGPWAPLLALSLYPILAITPITTDPITVIIGVAYGPHIGALIAFIGNTMAAAVEYRFGSKLSQSLNLEKEKNKMPFGLGKIPVNSPLFLILGRMIPGYGSKVISILAAAYKVPLKRYLWTSALTNLLGSILLAYGGFGLIKAIKFSF